MEAIGRNHKPEQWRLFIDASKFSLRAALLHNGIVLPSSIHGIFSGKYVETFLCEWDSRAKLQHYIVKSSPSRQARKSYR